MSDRDCAGCRAEDANIAREMGRMAKKCGQTAADPEVVGESIARAIEAQGDDEVTPTIIVVACEVCGALRKVPRAVP